MVVAKVSLCIIHHIVQLDFFFGFVLFFAWVIKEMVKTRLIILEYQAFFGLVEGLQRGENFQKIWNSEILKISRKFKFRKFCNVYGYLLKKICPCNPT